MIKYKNIEIKVNPRHLSYLRDIGYKDIKTNQIIQILTEQLPNNSNLKIDVICDCCKVEKKIKYQDYNRHTKLRTENYYCKSCNQIKNKKTCIEKYGVIHPMKLDSVKNKLKQVMLNNYGVDSYSKTDEYKFKFKKTCLEKYGVDNPFKSSDIKKVIEINKRESMENKNLWITLDLQSDFTIYKNKVRSLTKKNFKLIEWDGKDFYDGEYIKDNFNLHHLNNNYPTIDHKISIFDGFNMKLNPEEVANVDNLCWTKRIINITKNKKSSY